MEVEIKNKKEYIQKVLNSINNHSTKNSTFVEQAKKESMEHDLYKVEIYDQNGKVLLDIDIKPIPQSIKNRLPSFEKIEKTLSHEILPTKEHKPFIYIQTPLELSKKTIYINILLPIDDSEIVTIKDDIYGTILVVFVTIIIIFLSIYPIIYSQYKSLVSRKKELLRSNIDILSSLGSAVAKRDSDTHEHNYRVTYYSIKLAQKLKLQDSEIKTLIKGSFLHDIGKIAISDGILLKPGKLTEEEFALMQTHVNHGVDIVKNIKWLKDATVVIQNHHEKVDGSGYPNGLSKDKIPILAKIFAIADVFDALTSKRPYKKPMSLDKAIEILKEGSGTHFDSDVLEAFIDIVNALYEHIYTMQESELEKEFLDIVNSYFTQ
jgi:putative nucleotidyltransferase with HDIG domain